MNKQIGIWIDRKKAMILTLSEHGENTLQIESRIGRHIHFRGATHPKTPYSAQYQKGDDQLDRKFAQHLNKFYGKVIALIRSADSLLIFGPGEAKFELEERLAREKVRVPTVEIESAGRMTDRQIAAKIRKHFRESIANA